MLAIMVGKKTFSGKLKTCIITIKAKGSHIRSPLLLVYLKFSVSTNQNSSFNQNFIKHVLCNLHSISSQYRLS